MLLRLAEPLIELVFFPFLLRQAWKGVAEFDRPGHQRAGAQRHLHRICRHDEEAHNMEVNAAVSHNVLAVLARRILGRQVLGGCWVSVAEPGLDAAAAPGYVCS